MKIAVKIVVFIITSAFLTACSLPFSEPLPAERIYHLVMPTHNDAGDTTPIDKSLRVAVVDVGVGLDTRRIMALDNYEILPVMGARWAENTAQLLQKSLAYHLARQNLFRNVAGHNLGSASDWLLQLEVQAFYLVMSEDGEPESVSVSITAILEDTRSRATLFDSSHRSDIAVEGRDTTAVVAAFSRGVMAIEGELLGKVLAIEGN